MYWPMLTFIKLVALICFYLNFLNDIFLKKKSTYMKAE